MNTGEAVKDLRTRRGLTQKELAELIGMGQVHISLVENNKRGGRKLLDRIAEATGTEVHITFIDK